jgi:hypothetical protein
MTTLFAFLGGLGMPEIIVLLILAVFVGVGFLLWYLLRPTERRFGDNLPSRPRVKIRCKSCEGLNEETAKFCNQCGAPI